MIEPGRPYWLMLAVRDAIPNARNLANAEFHMALAHPHHPARMTSSRPASTDYFLPCLLSCFAQGRSNKSISVEAP